MRQSPAQLLTRSHRNSTLVCFWLSGKKFDFAGKDINVGVVGKGVNSRSKVIKSRFRSLRTPDDRVLAETPEKP